MSRKKGCCRFLRNFLRPRFFYGGAGTTKKDTPGHKLGRKEFCNLPPREIFVLKVAQKVGPKVAQKKPKLWPKTWPKTWPKINQFQKRFNIEKITIAILLYRAALTTTEKYFGRNFRRFSSCNSFYKC